MSVSPEVLKRIKKVAFYKYEPNVQNVLWAKPVGDGVYEFYVYYNGTWNIITEEEGVTVNISDVVGDLSIFNNDAGFVTSAEVQTALYGKQDVISNLNDIISGASAGSTALQPSDIASWAKQSTKPSYTASEVGALPDTTKYAGSQSVGGAANKAVSIPFGQVDSSSVSNAINVTVEGITELRDGVCCYIRNNVVNTVGGFTLNVNGLGAKYVYSSISDTAKVANQFSKVTSMLFIYNETRIEGGCWDLFFGVDTDQNDSAYKFRALNAGRLAYNTVKANVLLLSKGTQYVLAVNESGSTGTNKTLTTESFDPFGQIWNYTNGTFDVAPDGSVPNGYLWNQVGQFDARRSFNISTTEFELKKNVYLVAVPQSDGTAKLHSSPITQTLPSTEDGLIYIYLGIANAAYQFDLYLKHPIYYFKDGAIRQWTGEDSRISALEARNDSTYGVIRQTITWTTVERQGRVKSISDIEYGYIPNMFIKMATLGKGMATFNSSTGYFELNGLTDISYEEMVVIYNETKDMLQLGQASQWAILAHSNARTNLTTNNENNQMRSQKMTFSYGFQYASNLEVLNLDLEFGAGDETKTVVIGKSGFSSTFISCGVLRTILGKLDVSVDNSMFNYDNNGQSYTFQACTSLENIQLYGLRQNVSFRYCQPLSVESILYMINNEAATGAITITLNTYAYQRAIVDSDIIAATQNHPLITLADYTTGSTFNNGVETTA